MGSKCLTSTHQHKTRGYLQYIFRYLVKPSVYDLSMQCSQKVLGRLLNSVKILQIYNKNHYSFVYKNIYKIKNNQ